MLIASSTSSSMTQYNTEFTSPFDLLDNEIVLWHKNFPVTRNYLKYSAFWLEDQREAAHDKIAKLVHGAYQWLKDKTYQKMYADTQHLTTAMIVDNLDLLEAVKNGNFAAAQAILHGGANPNVQGQDGATPLMIAAANGHIKIVELLLAADANPNYKDSFGWTALICPILLNRQDIVTTIAQHPATDLTLDDDADEHAPLFHALDRGHIEIAIDLIRHGAAYTQQCQRLVGKNRHITQEQHHELLDAYQDTLYKQAKILK